MNFLFHIDDEGREWWLRRIDPGVEGLQVINGEPLNYLLERWRFERSTPFWWTGAETITGLATKLEQIGSKNALLPELDPFHGVTHAFPVLIEKLRAFGGSCPPGEAPFEI